MKELVDFKLPPSNQMENIREKGNLEYFLQFYCTTVTNKLEL